MDIIDIDRDDVVMATENTSASSSSSSSSNSNSNSNSTLVARIIACEKILHGNDTDMASCDTSDETQGTVSLSSLSSSSSSSTATTTSTTPSTTFKRRKVSFHADYTTDIYVLPSLTDYDDDDDDYEERNDDNNNNDRTELFWSDDDYKRFRTNEQKRYQKMFAKKLQRMVQERMQPRINEAVANGASLNDIEAMMPKTHEEMLAVLNDSGSNGIGDSNSSSNNNKGVVVMNAANTKNCGGISDGVPSLLSVVKVAAAAIG